MPARFFVAFVLILGLFAWVAPGFRLSADQRDTTIVGNADCVQDFPSTTAPDPRATVVMCGLANPRGLAFSHFALYVAEAGRGGLGLATCDLPPAPPPTPSHIFTGVAGGMRCYGPSGAISRLWNGIQAQVVTGLPSHALRGNGGQAIGPNDIALVSRHRHDDWAWAAANPEDCDPTCAYVTIGLQHRPEVRELYPFLADFGKLAQIYDTGEWRYIADIGTYEVQKDPDQEFYEPDKLDTNPYSLLATPSGRALVMTDAGGNSMLRVGTNGKISTLAVFPPHPDDSVPTSVAVGPDGAYYVGELSGFPPALGAANIYRVGRHSESPEVCLPGFTLIIDIAFDKRGNLYVLQYATNFQNASEGSLIRVDRHKGATLDPDDHGGLCAQYTAGNRTTVVTGLFQPTSVAVGPDGAVYISNRGSSAGRGQVIRFEPPAQ